ncbi:MAG TPA: hypothetical protein VN643_26025 [Pyrinomonadaceae bacterium]|nr:hypothetical protein [Pyrinomonadaceae bacterium]
MSANISRLSGEEWQRWANKLLTCHYGPTEYQTVPDNDKGDAGIEGFTITEGHCYQAFGCEEPIGTAARYKSQRKKMTTDVGKFINNRLILQRVFGLTKITRWVLFVPYADSKEIVVHASKKTEEVLAASLDYVANDFRVMVCQEEDFIIERDQLLSANAMTLSVSVEPSTEEAVNKWLVTNDRLAATLLEKIQRLPTIRDDLARQRFHTRVLKWYLEGQAILDSLRQYPETYEKVLRAKAHRENYLVMAAVSGRSPQEILTTSIQQLQEALKLEVRELHSFSAESLAHEAVADWLLRCPLDFPEINGHGSEVSHV